jgi:serine/threonine-protein kinase
VTGGWWLGFGRYTDTPDLLSLSKDNAIQEAERQGFHVAFGAPIYSENVPVDTVLAQQPSPGERVLRDGTITLYLSLGPERYAVPDVIGKEANFAQSLISAQLVVEIVDGYSDTLPPGYVAATEPAVGTLLPPGGTVKLFVVTGPFPVHVPDVVGRSLDDARNALRNAGFTDITVEERDDDRPKNTVLEQTPAANTGLVSASGQAVTLVVSRGPLLAMPNLVGAICGDAANQLEGLGVNAVTKPDEADLATWVVEAQSVPVGNKLTPGQTVQLTCKAPAAPGDG